MRSKVVRSNGEAKQIQVVLRKGLALNVHVRLRKGIDMRPPASQSMAKAKSFRAKQRLREASQAKSDHSIATA